MTEPRTPRREPEPRPAGLPTPETVAPARQSAGSRPSSAPHPAGKPNPELAGLAHAEMGTRPSGSAPRPFAAPAPIATDAGLPPLPPRPSGQPRPGAALPYMPRPGLEGRTARHKSDPTGLRLLLGLAGLASASAITTALLPSILPAAAVTSGPDTATAPQPQPSVIHVQRTVQLAPGQTAPPNSSVQVAPQPTPRIQIQVITRQSGRP